MKTMLSFTLLTVIIFLNQCNNPEQPTEVSSEAFIASWDINIPPLGTFIPDTLNIVLDLNDDKTFSLELNERTEKILYQSEGDWSFNDDSIFLQNNECLLLDTTANPDSLAPLADSICEQPIPLPHPQTDNEWTIQTASLQSLLLAFPVEQDQIENIVKFLKVITLDKEE